VRILEMIPEERFQFPHFIDEIVKTPNVSLQVKKTQDGPAKGIYNISMVIWRGNCSRSLSAQSVHQDFLFSRRFPIHRN